MKVTDKEAELRQLLASVQSAVVNIAQHKAAETKLRAI